MLNVIPQKYTNELEMQTLWIKEIKIKRKYMFNKRLYQKLFNTFVFIN